MRASILVALAISLSSGSLTRQQTVFRGRSDAVLVDVAVRNERQPVSGLHAQDFELFDNGIRQTVAEATVESLPVDATVLIDMSESVRRVFGDSLAAAGNKVRALFDKDDHVDVRLFGARIVDAAVWDRRPLGSWASGAWMLDRGTSLFDALVGALVHGHSAGFRRLVVLLTDGKDTSSFTSRETRLAVIDHADAVVQVVSLAFQGGNFSSHRDADSGAARSSGGMALTGSVGELGSMMQEVASRSGGYFFNLSESRLFLDTLGATIQEFRTRYLLRYVPSGVSTGDWHAISVHVKNKSYDVKARKGYWRG